MENSHFVQSLIQARKKSVEGLLTKTKLLNIEDYKNLSESEFFDFNGDMIGMLMYLIVNSNEELDFYVQSFSNLPDELHFGFFNLFDGKFSKKSYETYIAQVDKYFADKQALYSKEERSYPFIEMQGIRALVTIKLFDAYLDIDQGNYDSALKKLLILSSMDVGSYFELSGRLGFLYLMLGRVDEFDSINENCDYRDTLLDYLLAIHFFVNEEDKAAAGEVLKDAIFRNPLVIEVLRLTLEDQLPEIDYNTRSLFEAESIVLYITKLLKSQDDIEWFISTSTDIYAEILSDPQLMDLLQIHFQNDDIDDIDDIEDDELSELGTDDDDEDDDDNSENDGKIIQLYEK